ncbi:MAG: DUF2934 domain-containing protein [bacterium]|nr:DUF2934 domain-containing protein [bacterium]
MNHYRHHEKEETVSSKLSHEEVAKEAFLIYHNEGCPDGRDVNNWLDAEEVLLIRAISKISEK